jgi:SAM-dependent methyltransferase
MPHSDGLLTEGQLAEPEPKYPLELAFCPYCTLVQILETVSPDVLFGSDYPYYSSFSDTWVEHARRHALELMESRSLSEQRLVVEIASNDGYLLKHFAERGIPVLGIDPAPGPAQAAIEIGVPTRQAFFGADLGRELRSEGKVADVIVANNVLAHVADTNGFVEGLRILVATDGLVTIEVPYVRDLIALGEFDTIYHQHLCYFSLRSLDVLFRRHGLYINDVRRLTTHGGSLRIYVESREGTQPTVSRLLGEEGELAMDRLDHYRAFAHRVHDIRRMIRELVENLVAGGKRIAAYGAAAKGTIMLNYVGLGPDLVRYVVDRNVHKQGRYVPGVRLPIHGPEYLMEDRPDYLIILPWNLTDEITAQQADYRAAGGQFIVPIPEPRIL